MSYVTPFILFVLGVLIWHHQLSAKRRFEVAEQVLAAFPTASDGLSTLRSPMIWAAEIENAKPKKDKEGEDQADDEAPKDQEQGTATTRARVEMHNVYVALRPCRLRSRICGPHRFLRRFTSVAAPPMR
jgi:hypothetical protein